MAASSPIPNNKVGDSIAAIAIVNGNTTPQRPIFLDTPKQNLRGLNKPKCIKCGNVARSRCPFQSCKSCCAKAQNPCHIHVLKQNGTLPDKPPPSSTTSTEQPSSEAPSTGSSWRLSSLRQLSTTFVNSLRAKKPLSRKDAVNINKWRFSKLKEHVKGSIEAENEAFERYLRNVSLLEETFSVEGLKPDDHPALEPAASEDEIRKLVSTIKVKLKSNAEKADSFRERIRSRVDQKLRKLQERELVNDADSRHADELDTCRELKRPKVVEEWQAERTAAVNDLVDKLNKARSEDDLKSCLEMKLQLFNQSESKAIDTHSDPVAGDLLMPEQESDSIPALSFSLPKACTIVPIDQDTLSNISAEFSALNQIAEL